MYYVSAQGVDERMINVHYDYYYYYVLFPNEVCQTNAVGIRLRSTPLFVVLSTVCQKIQAYFCRDKHVLEGGGGRETYFSVCSNPCDREDSRPCIL